MAVNNKKSTKYKKYDTVFIQTSAAVEAESNSIRMGRPSAMYTRLSIGNLYSVARTHGAFTLVRHAI